MNSDLVRSASALLSQLVRHCLFFALLLDNSTSTAVTQKAYSVDEAQIKQVLNRHRGREVESNFIGRIIDQNNQPIIGADVSLGNQLLCLVMVTIYFKFKLL